MTKWESEKENLETLILIDNISYEEIGRMYGCTGANIKKVAKKLGIELPIRNSLHGKSPSNKGTGKKYYCLNCGKELSPNSTTHKYCSNKCQQDFEYKQKVEAYKQDNTIAKSTKWGHLPAFLRRYIFEKFDNKCCLCGWSKVNPYTNTLPLEIDHIDGNAENNAESNLRLICPNCHSLTATYRGANRGNGRSITWTIKNSEANED